MSIVIKANELNCLIYKYLQENGLDHTAYALFNESGLAASLQQFKFDIRAGHLVGLLEKALLFTQIESHIALDEHLQCTVPFNLLKPHTCSITAVATIPPSTLMKKFSSSIDDAIKRTNLIYHAQVKNDEYDDIVYEPKGKRFWERFGRVKIRRDQADGQTNAKQNHAKDEGCIVEGWGSDNIAVYDCDEEAVTMLTTSTPSDLPEITSLLPCISQGSLSHPTLIAPTPYCTLLAFPQGYLTSIPNNSNDTIEFKLDIAVIDRIQCNMQIPTLIAVMGEGKWRIINLQTGKIISKGEGSIWWRKFEECLVLGINKKSLSLRNIRDMSSSILEYDNYDLQINNVQVSESGLFFSILSVPASTSHVFLFTNDAPLYLFPLPELKCNLFLWSKQVEYAAFLAGNQLLVFELELNAWSKRIPLQNYDASVNKIVKLSKGEGDVEYLVGVGSGSLVVCDVGQGKVERMEMDGQSIKNVKELGKGLISVETDTYLYFIKGSQVEALFK